MGGLYTWDSNGPEYTYGQSKARSAIALVNLAQRMSC